MLVTQNFGLNFWLKTIGQKKMVKKKSDNKIWAETNVGKITCLHFSSIYFDTYFELLTRPITHSKTCGGGFT